MRATVLLDTERPKVSEREVIGLLRSAGIEFSTRRADFGVVVGGDGLFSYYGRQLDIPLLFVGVRSDKATDTKAHLAEVLLDDLESALRSIRADRFGIAEYRRLEVIVRGASRGESFTDVCLEKGADSNCLRYEIRSTGQGFEFTDSAIANGVIVCTRAGSTGYYSYIDKLRLGDWLEPNRHTMIGENETGVCHIAPTYTKRENMPEHPLRFTVPWGTTFRIVLMRDADARLFGVTKSRRGIRIRARDTIVIKPSENTTKVIKVSTFGAREPPPPS